MPSLTIDVKFGGKLHKRICDGVRERITASRNTYQNRHEKWKKADDAAVGYLHARDVDKLRDNKRKGGAPQYTTIQVPYSYGVLMASHTYWTTVFMSRAPVLQFTGRHGETEQQIQALEALIDYQVQVGEMLVPWYCWLYDVGKYGVGLLGNYWEEEFANVSKIVEREEMFLGMLKTGVMKKVKVTERIPGYQGNKLYNIRPYDFFPDPRVPLMLFQTGEFCGISRKLGWNTILKRAEQGYYINIEELRKYRHGGGTGGTYETNGADGGAERNSNMPTTADFGLGKTDARKLTGENSTIPIIECYIDLVPSEWKLGKGELPEKWVFTTDDKFNVVVGAQPLGAHHDKFPVLGIELEPDGYSLVSRGMPEILEPVQNTVDWLINSHFYNVRKILNGQYVVDPSRITMMDLLDPQPGGIIRLKPAGYNSDPAQAIKQLTAMDVTASHVRDMQVMLEIGQRAVGVNDQLMGVLQGSGRKTATEVRSASTFGVNRLKTNAEFFGALGWGPMGQMIVQNSQQYYDAEMKFKLVGDLAQEAGSSFVNVDPAAIAGFYDFVPVDGTLPIDRFAQANLWKEIMGQLRTMPPQVAAGYDLVRMFAWVAQLAGLKNINQFKIQTQVMPPLQEEQLPGQVQAGNVVPLGPQSGTNANLNEPGQIPGMGATG